LGSHSNVKGCTSSVRVSGIAQVDEQCLGRPIDTISGQ
jgi:hypothetical protein